jgi:hypothetical protein
MTPAMILRLITVLALALGASLAAAADDAYPPGSRIRLTPPPGMVTSKSFFGYEDPDNNATIILLALPAQAYADLDKSVTADALKRQGVTFETREAMPLSTGDAFLVLGHQDVENIKPQPRSRSLASAQPGNRHAQSGAGFPTDIPSDL